MTISVSQLNNYIRGIFDMDGVLNDLSVCGEVTNVKKTYNGWYFTLKDDDAAVNCFCYANSNEPVAGAMAVAEGQLNYFVKGGTLSFFVRRLTSTANTGAAYQKFVELRDKLGKEGLFDEARKQPVPHSARKIGVVTSETGAVIHDIENVALRRQPFSEIVLYPVKVQGAGADAEIVNGIEYFGKSDVDVVIVGRGGGSNEDLSVFNSEIVVRAIAECPKPTVSAVGHGVDFTLSDFAADKRAVTPSEAAEFVTLDVAREKLRILARLDKVENFVASQLSQNFGNIQNDCKLLYLGVGRKVQNCESTIGYSLKAVANAALSRFSRTEAELDKSSAKLDKLNPMKLLKRGYGYVTSADGVVKSVAQLQVGTEITVNLHDGRVGARVTRKEEK